MHISTSTFHLVVVLRLLGYLVDLNINVRDRMPQQVLSIPPKLHGPKFRSQMNNLLRSQPLHFEKAGRSWGIPELLAAPALPKSQGEIRSTLTQTHSSPTYQDTSVR